MSDGRLAPDHDPTFERIPGRGGYGGSFGDTFQKVTSECCLVAFQVRPEHLNYRNVCHGGALMTFADIALSRAGRMGLPPDQTVEVTASLSMEFIAPARAGEWVVATCRALRRTRHLVFTQATFLAGDSIVANSSAIFAVLTPAGGR